MEIRNFKASELVLITDPKLYAKHYKDIAILKPEEARLVWNSFKMRRPEIATKVEQIWMVEGYSYYFDFN